MALEWQDVEMRIEEVTDREEVELDRSTAYEFAPEPKRAKLLDSAPEIKERYWNCRPLFDMQYKELYDTMKKHHLDEVLQEKEIICSWKVKPCASLKIAKEIVKPHQYGDISPLTESQIICCLTDLIKERRISEELCILKEYELFLLNSGYWMAWQCYRKGDRTEIQNYEKYDHSTCFDFSGYSLADVQKCFEKWIFKLMPEEDKELEVALKHVERDDRNRKRMLFRTTRAEYITMKLEKAVQWGIPSMDKLELELRNNKGRQPFPADIDVI